MRSLLLASLSNHQKEETGCPHIPAGLSVRLTPPISPSSNLAQWIAPASEGFHPDPCLALVSPDASMQRSYQQSCPVMWMDRFHFARFRSPGSDHSPGNYQQTSWFRPCFLNGGAKVISSIHRGSNCGWLQNPFHCGR